MAPSANRRSAFDQCGIDLALDAMIEEITAFYLADTTPWVVGYSGGKDSTAVLQLVWNAIERLGSAQAQKKIHVISTDTLVENPIVSAWVTHSIKKINSVAADKGLPIEAHCLTPEISDSFWVNLIGRGYPAPRQRLRWCTDRLKIKPSNAFISSMVDQYGEAMLVLGTRKAESASRAQSLKKHQSGQLNAKISSSSTLKNTVIYSPIEDWANDDVWQYVLEYPNPWGHSNMELFEMYKGASEDGECPLVVSSNTPSCGDSRFGCWVCTLVEKDKSMQAMIRNDEDKKWMLPLLEIRSEIDFRNMPENADRHLRDFRRMNGSVMMYNGKPAFGPYKQHVREGLLRKLLAAQETVREFGPKEFAELVLIRLDELEEIRRIWVVDKHELEDTLPGIYSEVTSEPYPGNMQSEEAPFRQPEMELLKEICGADSLQYEMLRELLSVEYQHKNALKRHKLFSSIENAIRRSFYDDQDDATTHAKRKAMRLVSVSDKTSVAK